MSCFAVTPSWLVVFVCDFVPVLNTLDIRMEKLVLQGNIFFFLLILTDLKPNSKFLVLKLHF